MHLDLDLDLDLIIALFIAAEFTRQLKLYFCKNKYAHDISVSAAALLLHYNLSITAFP